MACGIQLVQVNDVYEIDWWPAYSSVRKRAAHEFSSTGTTVGVLPGDFVSPSLLSSIDKGLGMVDCMNASGIDYVCIGNHESDIPLNALHQRIRQSKFTWLNSNMPKFPLPTDGGPPIVMPVYKIIDLCSPSDPTHKRKVGLIGLCGEDRSVMSKGAFGDCEIDPLAERCRELVAYLINDLKCDAVIPMTHQLVQQDRDLAASLGPEFGPKVPYILGGHDHEPFNEAVNGSGYTSSVIKTGADGKLIAMVQITWPSKDANAPTGSVAMLKANDVSDPDAAVAQIVDNHKAVLKEIEASTLCAIPPSLLDTMTSIGMRVRPTTMGTFLCSVLRDALQVECVLVGAGSIRGNRSYKGVENFSYAHLKAEIPFHTIITLCNLPGRVIAEMVCYTRAFALQTPPVEKGGYLQSDDSLDWESSTNTVKSIGGRPLDPDRVYSVGLSHGMLAGLDNVKPLLGFMQNAPPSHSVHKSPEAGHEAKHVLVAHFSSLLLWDVLIRAGGMEGLDQDGDNSLTRAELLAGLQRTAPATAATNILVDNLFNCADEDGDGVITSKELVKFSLSSMLKYNFANAGQSSELDTDTCLLSIEDIEMELAQQDSVFSTAQLEAVRALLAAIDTDGSGFISRAEYAALLDSQMGHSFVGATRVNI